MPRMGQSTPSFARRFWPLFLLGLLGLASLPLRIAEQIAAMRLPPSLAELPHAAVVLLSLVNPFILLVLTALLGAAAAHRSGLVSWAAGTGAPPGRRTWLLALAGGLGLAAAITAADAAWRPLLSTHWQALLGPSGFSWKQLLVGMLYGGLTEEIMLRWGVMAALAWLLHKLFARRAARAPGWAVALAALLAAVLFAAGHLPAVMAMGEVDAAMVARTLALNTVAGLAYGWLFWRHALEAAMAAHAATHVGFALAALLF
jgi:hypothetical protein